MRKYIVYTLIYIIACMTTLTFGACADVDLCENHDGSHNAIVRYSYKWEARQNASRAANDTIFPSKMYAIAHRVVNDWRRVDTLSTASASDTITIRPGEYRFFTVPMAHNAIDMSEIKGFLDQTAKGNSLHDKHLNYTLYSREQLKNVPTDWTDENPYAQYIMADAEPFYYDETELIQNFGGLTVVEFKPKDITQLINLSLRINKDQSERAFAITAVYAELAGIPVSMTIGNRYVSMDKTAKVIIPMKANVANNAAAAASSDLPAGEYVGKILVPTVLNSTSADETTGAGIMQLIVCITTTDENGTPVKRTLHKKVNLYNTLASAHLTTFAEDDEQIISNGESGNIRINQQFVLTAQEIK